VQADNKNNASFEEYSYLAMGQWVQMGQALKGKISKYRFDVIE